MAETNINLNEHIDPSQDVPKGRNPIDTEDLGSNLLGVNTGLTRAKILHILNDSGIDAEEKKVDVVEQNPNNPSQTFTHQEIVIDGLPDNAPALVAEYLDEHQDKVLEAYEIANELLPEIKDMVVEGLARYGESLGLDKDHLAEIFKQRLNSITEVHANDWLLDSDSSFNFNSGVGANFSMRDGKNKLTIIPAEIRKGADLRKQDLRTAIRLSLTHELEHAASYIGTVTGRDAPRSGLRANDINESGQMLARSHGGLLLDEGSQEDILWKADLERAEDVTYIQQVIFWNGLLAIRPDLEKTRFEAKFLNTPGSRGYLVGEIESIFGPFAVEEIDRLIAELDTLRKLPQLKDRIVELANVDREQLRTKMDETQTAILEPLGFGYSDAELSKALEENVILSPKK